MNEQLTTYITTKRDAGLDDDQIRANLITSGWAAEIVDAALKADLSDDVPPPPPPPLAQPISPASNLNNPIAVMNVSTTRGIEYLIMFIALWITATAIASLLHHSVETLSGIDGIYYGIAPLAAPALIVSLPIFGYLFLRLKKAEIEEPEIRKDPSRKRAIQLTLLVTFLIGIGKIIAYLFSLINGGGEGGGIFEDGYETEYVISPIYDILHAIITLGIAGGIFVYYWRDIHKKDL
ncbi:MAG: DUF5671 domain-containing protein [Candidatus Saccharimonadales bacterium]